MPDTLHLHPLERLDDPLLLPFLDLYESAFPQNEREPVSSLLAPLQARVRGETQRLELRAAVDETGAFVGMAIYELRPDLNLAFLQNLAVAPERRNGGWCGRLFRALQQEMSERLPPSERRLLVFEVEDPEQYTGEARDWAARRLQFYRRLGARLLMGGVRYTLTIRGWGEPLTTPLLLAFASLPGGPPPDAETAFAAARALFGESVERTSDPLQIQ